MVTLVVKKYLCCDMNIIVSFVWARVHALVTIYLVVFLSCNRSLGKYWKLSSIFPNVHHLINMIPAFTLLDNNYVETHTHQLDRAPKFTQYFQLVIGIECIWVIDMCGGCIAIYHKVDCFRDIEVHLDIRQHQQHRAF